MNIIEIEGLVDTGEDMTIWYQNLGIPHWLLQEVNVQILGNETISDKTKYTVIECIGSEEQREERHMCLT